jgi:5-oxopent-3-ene-1,2,5-tricarboxylate decarboxylase/2-hydroxyhepta-2,4-diene-1,7-dioate isomerase
MNTTYSKPHATVYGVVLNDRESLQALGDQLLQPPYLALPRAPVMHIKPANTWRVTGDVVPLPAGEQRVEIGATLGLLIGRSVSQSKQASTAIAAYIVMADLSLPHSSYYRPAIKEKCFDGACPMSAPIPLTPVMPLPSQMCIETYINGVLAERRQLSDLLRQVPELLQDVSAFMTLHPQDVLHIGVVHQGVQASPGDQIRIVIPEVGELQFSLAVGVI